MAGRKGRLERSEQRHKDFGDVVKSWFDPRTEKRESPIEGRGLFAREPIGGGETVAVKGGAILDRAAFERVRDAVSPAEIQIEDDLFIAPLTAGEVEANLLCLNHSCDPNVGVRGQVSFVTMRDVPAGAELTIDDAMIDGGPGERMAPPRAAAALRRLLLRYVAERIAADPGS